MSHSITTTVSYVLDKYSRSYPSSISAQAPAEPEWQHFTNPVMKVTLEAKKPPSGQLVSMRLKILWSMHTEPSDLYIDQRDVIFEDLELLSFSSLTTFQTSGAQPDQSLPLKAVYRDAIVGVRYLHPRIVPPGSQPVYRRFQITFKDAQDASRCIDAIKSVCPCKAIPQSTHLNRHPTMLSASLMRTATSVSSSASMRHTGLTERQNIAPAPIDTRLVPPTMLSHPSDSQPFSIAPSSVGTSLSSDDSVFVTCSETSYRADTQVDHRKDGPRSRGRDAAQSSLPSSSQLSSSSDQCTAMPPPPVPQRVVRESADAMAQEPPVNVGDERSQLLASLTKHPTLYELSQTELETLVSQVIREEGFLHLLESIDSLWRAKGFLGR